MNVFGAHLGNRAVRLASHVQLTMCRLGLRTTRLPPRPPALGWARHDSSDAKNPDDES